MGFWEERLPIPKLDKNLFPPGSGTIIRKRPDRKMGRRSHLHS